MIWGRLFSAEVTQAFIAHFIWLGENIGTFFGVWRYPNQMGPVAPQSMAAFRASGCKGRNGLRL